MTPGFTNPDISNVSLVSLIGDKVDVSGVFEANDCMNLTEIVRNLGSEKAGYQVLMCGGSSACPAIFIKNRTHNQCLIMYLMETFITS
jgi:hypothetical protein